MPTIKDLPTEILLDIFESHSLSLFDLLRIRSTCFQWRHIIHTSTTLQERLWLQPEKSMKQLRKPKIKPAQLNINVLVRRLPATIWNGYQEDMWEMTWCQDEETPTIPWPRNLIVTDLEDFLYIINPHFVQAPPYKGCGVRMPMRIPLSLAFRGLNDLKQKTEHIDAFMDKSWCKMLISQHYMRAINAKFEIDIRYGARDHTIAGRVCCKSVREEGEELKMEDLVDALQGGLTKICQVLEANGIQ